MFILYYINYMQLENKHEIRGCEVLDEPREV